MRARSNQHSFWKRNASLKLKFKLASEFCYQPGIAPQHDLLQHGRIYAIWANSGALTAFIGQAQIRQMVMHYRMS